MFSSATPEFSESAQGVTGGTPWGPGAASAESCTRPAKRDRCFPPPIVERQRLPNVGITLTIWCSDYKASSFDRLYIWHRTWDTAGFVRTHQRKYWNALAVGRGHDDDSCSCLTLAVWRLQPFSRHFHWTWQEHDLDLKRVQLWRFYLVKYAHNGPFHEPVKFRIPWHIFQVVTFGTIYRAKHITPPQCFWAPALMPQRNPPERFQARLGSHYARASWGRYLG